MIINLVRLSKTHFTLNAIGDITMVDGKTGEVTGLLPVNNELDIEIKLLPAMIDLLGSELVIPERILNGISELGATRINSENIGCII